MRLRLIIKEWTFTNKNHDEYITILTTHYKHTILSPLGIKEPFIYISGISEFTKSVPIKQLLPQYRIFFYNFYSLFTEILFILPFIILVKFVSVHYDDMVILSCLWMMALYLERTGKYHTGIFIQSYMEKNNWFLSSTKSYDEVNTILPNISAVWHYLFIAINALFIIFLFLQYSIQ